MLMEADLPDDVDALRALVLEQARALLKEHGNYEWLSSSGKLVVLNNGIEFAATYLVMLVALFFSGAGRWLSLDYWLSKALRKQP